MRALLIILTILLILAQPAAAQPYSLPDTQVLKLRSTNTGASYELFIATPPGYREAGRTFPVVYMLDADYSFALVRNIVRHFIEREDMPPVVLVAIAYPGAASSREAYRMHRTRDYTPVFAPDGGYGAEYQKVSGGAPKFRAFLARELIPFIESRFPVTPDDRTLIGHSYGGLFATYVLLTEPSLFQRYIAVSPSLWYANRTALTMEEAAARSGIRPRARVFYAVGANENAIMEDDLAELVKKLRSRGNPGLKVTMRVYEDETHNSVFPGAVTRGLLTVFDRPPSSGSTTRRDPVP
jgi:uncharacterized protein